MDSTFEDTGRGQPPSLQHQAEEWAALQTDYAANLPIGVYRTTPGALGIFLRANPAMVHMLGFDSEAELCRVPVASVYQDPGQRVAFSNRVVAEGSVTGVELLLRKRDGTPRWTSVTAKAVRHPGTGEVVFFDCTAEDITQRKRAAEMQALLYGITNAVQVARDEHELFAAIHRELARVMDASNFFIAIYDPSTDIVTLPYFVDEKDKIYQFAAQKSLTGLMLHRGMPLLVTDRDIQALIAAGQVELVGTLCKVWLGVPLEIGGQVRGALVVQSYADETAFGREEMEILEFISNQVGLASERVRAREELKLALETQARHAREMAALYETSLEINAQRDLASLLRAIVARASSLLNTRMGGLYLLKPDGQSLELVVGHNLPGDLAGTILALGEGLSGRVARTGEPLMVDDYSHWPGQADVYAELSFRRVLGVPLKVGEQVIGVINITDDSETGPFTEDQVRLVSLFADQAALAIQNTRLFEAEARRRREAETLRMATQAVSASLDLQEVLRLILSELRQVVPYDSASVQQLRADNQMEIVGGFGFPNLDDLLGVTFDLDATDNPNRQVARSRAPLILEDASATYDEFRQGKHAQAGIRSWLGVPLLFGERLVGMIAIDKREPGFYTDEHARLAQAFAAQAAIAMENARLFQAEREQRDLAEALRQATAAVSGTLDLDQMLDQLLEQVDRVIPNDAVNINLINGDECRIVRWRGYERFGFDVQGLALSLQATPSFRTMYETGEPVVFSDTRANPGWVTVSRVAWVRSYAAVPIRVRDQIIGFLNVDSATPGFFTPAHAERLRAFADQVSLALTNAQLFSIVEQARRDWEVTFDAMQDPVVLVDAQANVLRANQAFAALLDQGTHEVVGRPFDWLFEDGSCPTPPCRLHLAIEDGQAASCIHTHGRRTFDVQATPVSGDLIGGRGHEVRAIYAMRDITERKRAEEEVNRRNRDLAFLNRIIAASAARQSTESLLVRVCQEVAQAFNARRAAAVLLDEKGQATVVATSAQGGLPKAGTTVATQDSHLARLLAESGEIWPIRDVGTETELKAGDPLLSPGTVACLLVPLHVEGKVAGYLELDGRQAHTFAAEELALAGRVADQVSSALARARLEEAQRRLIAVVEQAAEAVVITDTNNVVLDVNPAFESLTGRSRAEVVGLAAQPLLLRGEEWAAHLLAWTPTDLAPFQRRVTNHRADGSPYTVDLTLTSVRNQDGDVVNLVMTMRDVTREMQLEQQFRQAQKLDSLGRLAGGIAHDFNNLLTVIHLSSTFLEKQLHPEDPLWEHVQHIRQTGERAAKLTKHLLSFSRREVTDPQVLGLTTIVGDLSRMLQRIIGEDIELRLELAADTWPVKADPAQIEQVIMNLVVNARDAMPVGGVVTIRTANVTLDQAYVAFHVDAEPGDHVLLSVSDTGHGMDDDVQVHLFEPFFTTKGRGQGTGLGLSTVFGIVKQSGGHIRAESQVGTGTAFFIYLPRSEEGTYPADVPLPQAASRALGGQATVLVVEDDAGVRNLAIRVLKSSGYRVLEARNGAEALRLSQEYGETIDLLVTDMVMPHMNGRDLAQRLHDQRPAIRALYMSGYADNLSLPLPPDTAFLGKPFSADDLLQKVQSLLRK